jgi:hypothetical protein
MKKGATMFEMPWLDRLPGGTLDGAVELANRLYWAISVDEHQGRWVVRGGEVVLLRTDSRQTVEAFLYGLGLAYGAIAREAFEQLEACIKELVDPEPAGTAESSDMP